MFGVEPGAMRGSLTELRDTTLVENRQQTREQIDAAIGARLPFQSDDMRIRRRDGEFRILHGVRRFLYLPPKKASMCGRSGSTETSLTSSSPRPRPWRARNV